MTLLDEMKEDRESALERRQEYLDDIEAATRSLRDAEAYIADLDKAIAALRTPAAAEDTAQDRVEPLLDQGQSLPDQSSSQESETDATDPADLPAPTDAEFQALEKLDAEPEAQILREHVPLDAPVIEDATGEQFALIQGEPVQIVSEEPKPEPEPPHEPHSEELFEAHKHGGEAGYWASLFLRKKVDA